MTHVQQRVAFGFTLALLSTAALAAPAVAPAPAMATSAAAANVETRETTAQATVGANAKGANWTVDPTVHSDGFMRNFALDTPYGRYQVSGQKLLTTRLQELKAVAALEGMSNTDVFVEALGEAGMKPIRFGRDLVTAPLETTDRLVSGVANMFDRASDEISNRDSSRDPLIGSALGVQSAKRQLAYQLGVDPYTDFPPLAEGLEDVARVMAAGDISVSAAMSAIPGGAGVAVSGVSTASTVAQPIRDKSSAEIAAMVTEKLTALHVSKDRIEAFLANTAYSPADQLAIAEALTQLQAKNSDEFIARATAANSTDVAKFQRFRAELIAKESERLGSLGEFVTVSGFALNRDKKGALVAVFPFDEVAWTDIASRSLTELSADVAKRGEKQKPTFVTTGEISAVAQAELTRLGWKVVKI